MLKCNQEIGAADVELAVPDRMAGLAALGGWNHLQSTMRGGGCDLASLRFALQMTRCPLLLFTKQGQITEFRGVEQDLRAQRIDKGVVLMMGYQ